MREAPPADVDALHDDFVERRDRLNTHDRAMHASREPSGLSVYALYGRIVNLPPDAVTRCRLPLEALRRSNEAMLETWCEHMREMVSLAPLVTGTSLSPWRGAKLISTDEVRKSVERARRLAHERWPRWESRLVGAAGRVPDQGPDDGAQSCVARSKC